MILVRPATSTDWHAVGVLVQEGIFDAPSSLYTLDDLPIDPLKLGQQLTRLGEEDVAVCLVADVGLGLGGICHVLWGEFSRCRHSVHASLLVHPGARRLGVGRELLRVMAEHFRGDDCVSKITLSVSETDQNLERLVVSEGWRLERASPLALDLEGRKVALRHWALDVAGEV